MIVQVLTNPLVIHIEECSDVDGIDRLVIIEIGGDHKANIRVFGERHDAYQVGNPGRFVAPRAEPFKILKSIFGI